MDTIVTAILAKDKGFCLPFYLKCIYNQTISKNKIHLYIRTNDNKDNTVEVLKEFIEKYGNEYASVYYDDSSISEELKKYEHHEWNAVRFKILGKIRQESIDHAIKLNAHYFVADCDNFIIPKVLENLLLNSSNGVISPMLVTTKAYSNYHYDIDKNGYFKNHDLYNSILKRDIKGLINVPVVHCTYFINNKFLKNICYDDNSYRYEYVIFSHSLRKNNIKQFLDNQEFYGFLEFVSTKDEFDKNIETKWNNIIIQYFTKNTNNKKTLIIAPNASFGNRLRSMVSAIYLSEKLQMNIEHVWIGTPYKCAYAHIQDIHDKGLEYFFKPSIKRCDYKNMSEYVHRVYTEWMPNHLPNSWYNFQSYGQKLLETTILSKLNLVNEEMNASENFLIETTYINNLKITNDDKKRIYSKHFIPNDNFIKKIGNVDANTVGVSIRNGEFFSYFPESKINDLIIQKWLSSIESPVILFSDDKKLEKELRNYLKNPVKPTFESMSYDDNPFLQFLLLSKCSKLYGTEFSSFCEEAAIFGDCEYIPLNNEFFKLFSKNNGSIDTLLIP